VTDSPACGNESGALDDVTYRVIAVERAGRWVARAEARGTGRSYGIECFGASRTEAIERLTLWLEWQQAHAEALAALQAAERAYHRSVAHNAFASPAAASSTVELRKVSLDRVEAARVRLDDIRARRPEMSERSNTG
jgi:hypothetical protein